LTPTTIRSFASSLRSNSKAASAISRWKNPFSMQRSTPPCSSIWCEVPLRATLHLIGKLLDEVRAAQRVDGVGDARFVREHLLGA